MSKEIFINLEKEVLHGNVLDVGLCNYGIVYEMCKHVDDNIAVDYVSGNVDNNIVEKGFYDSCVVFFSFREMGGKRFKLKFVKEIANFLKRDGILYLWDIDKPLFKVKSLKLKVVVPNTKMKEIKIRAFNPLKDFSINNTFKLLQPYFNILDFKCSDDIYYIKAQASSKK